MKKYIIKDSQGSKKTIYAENITHALTFVEDSKKINDSKFYAEEDASEAKRRASKYGLQIKVGKKVSNGPNRGFDEIYYIGPRDKLTKMLKAEGFDDDEIIDMIEDSKVKDEVSSAEIDEAIDNIADKYGGFYSRTYDKVFKDLKAKYPSLKYEDVRRAIVNYAENSSSANAQLRVAKKYFSDSINDVDISFDKRIKKAVERGKLHDFAFNGLYAMKASKAEFPELKQELEKRNYKNIMFSNNPYNRYNVFFRDEASSVTTINALVNDEKAAIDSYNVAIKNLEGKIDEKAMQVLINIRNDERRHIENLYSILNGQVTEKNLEDSRMKDSKYYVGISTHGYTKEQAERDARKFGLQLKIVGKSRDPHFEYDAYFIGPRNNILKMLKANDLEEFEEDIEDSVHDAKLKESNGVYYKLERGYWNVLSIHNDKEMDHQDVMTLARKNNVIIEPFFKHDYHRTDKGGYYYTDYRVKGKDKNAVIRFCEAMNPRVKPLNFEE